jgi:hypothetical protein
MSLLDKLKKNSTIKETSVLSKSMFFEEKVKIPTIVPAMNIALTATLDEGIMSGLTVWAGPSKHFKTAFSLLMAKTFLDKYPDGVILFYDSEFGSPKSYFESFGISLDRVLHTPLLNIEKFKFDIMAQLNELTRDDKVLILVDSMGNLASIKEIEDALAEKGTADMTRAKQIKSVFRMVTPYLTVLDIPMVVVNHTYKTQETYSKDVVSGGTGIYYSADTIFILGRQQETQGEGKDKEILGYDFIINVEKSRFVKEKSKIPISVRWDGGISTWSGLLEMALEAGLVVKPKNGWYQKVDLVTGEMVGKSYRKKETDTREFWLEILNSQRFKDWITNEYKVSNGSIITDEELDQEFKTIASDAIGE